MLGKIAFFSLCALFAAGLSASCGPGERSVQEPADLVLRGGRIVTLDDKIPEAEARNVAGCRSS